MLLRDCLLIVLLALPFLTLGSVAEDLKGTIAFHSNREGDFEIFVMNADGSRVTQLTHNTYQEFDPIWSPNGHQIAFARFGANGGDGEIVVINEDGSGEKILTNNELFDFPGAWSHDGKRIAFTSDRDGDLEVYVMNADGSGVTQLTHNDFTSDIPTAWSPNGKQIVFLATATATGNSS
jgi:Tol biopolymer transport system component